MTHVTSQALQQEWLKRSVFRRLQKISRDQWRIQKFWRGGGRQFISSVLIYRKCAQRNIWLLHGKSGFLKKIWANRGAGAPTDAPHRIRHWQGRCDVIRRCCSFQTSLAVSYITSSSRGLFSHDPLWTTLQLTRSAISRTVSTSSMFLHKDETVIKNRHRIATTHSNSCCRCSFRAYGIMTASLDKQPLRGDRVSACNCGCASSGTHRDGRRGECASEWTVCRDSAIKVLTTNRQTNCAASTLGTGYRADNAASDDRRHFVGMASGVSPKLRCTPCAVVISTDNRICTYSLIFVLIYRYFDCPLLVLIVNVFHCLCFFLFNA